MSISVQQTSISRFLGKRASCCRKCGGSSHYVNRLGGLSCESCVPAENGLSAGNPVHLEIEGGVWIDPVDSFGASGAVADSSASSTITSPPVRGGNPAAPPAPATTERPAGSAADQGRSDPPLADRHRQVIVSTRLVWFLKPVGTYWDGEITVVGVTSPGNPPHGIYRPLSQPWFGWLVERVLQLPDEDVRGSAWRELLRIACEAVNARVFGEWALDDTTWPRKAPATGFDAPRLKQAASANLSPLDWERLPSWGDLVFLVDRVKEIEGLRAV